MIPVRVRQRAIRRAAIRVVPWIVFVAACSAEPETPDPADVCKAFALSRCMTVAAMQCNVHEGSTSEELTNCPQFVACQESRLEECTRRMAETGD